MKNHVRTDLAGLLSIALIIAAPLVAVYAQEEVTVTQETVGKPARLAGTVIDQAGMPVAGVRVIAAIPGIDMRSLYGIKDVKTVEAVTNELGRYQMIFQGIASPTEVSIDAMKPHFERFSGVPMIWCKPLNVTLSPAQTSTGDLQLRPSGYFAGTVVDENGNPIDGIQVHASSCTATGCGWIETTRTNSKGEFEIFNYHETSISMRDKGTRGVVSFTHPSYLNQDIDDIYQLAANERTAQRVVMPFGRSISGLLQRADGEAAVNVMVRAISEAPSCVRKAVMTDHEGRFALKGLPGGKVTVTSKDFAREEKIKRVLDLAADEKELDLRMETISIPKDFKTYNVLGMQLTDLNEEWKVAYDFWTAEGVLILDPGKLSERLKIGRLEKGDYFSEVGSARTESVKELASQIIKEAESQNGATFSIGVVYLLTRLEGDSSTRQYMQLSQEDIEGLKRLRD